MSEEGEEEVAYDCDDDVDGMMHALPVGDAASRINELARVAANGERISCNDDDIVD